MGVGVGLWVWACGRGHVSVVVNTRVPSIFSQFIYLMYVCSGHQMVYLFVVLIVVLGEPSN